MRQVSCFGLGLVKLDIRQESDRHTDVMDAITNHLGIVSYRNWSEEQRQVCTPIIRIFYFNKIETYERGDR